MAGLIAAQQFYARRGGMLVRNLRNCVETERVSGTGRTRGNMWRKKEGRRHTKQLRFKFCYSAVVQCTLLLTDTCVAVYELARGRKNTFPHLRLICASTSPFRKQKSVATQRPCNYPTVDWKYKMKKLVSNCWARRRRKGLVFGRPGGLGAQLLIESS